MFIGSEAKFTCGIRNAPFFAWRVNGTFLSQLDPSLRADLNIFLEIIGNTGVFTLTIPARAEYNGTVVQCIASVPGGTFRESENASLFIQGN